MNEDKTDLSEKRPTPSIYSWRGDPWRYITLGVVSFLALNFLSRYTKHLNDVVSGLLGGVLLFFCIFMVGKIGTPRN